MSLDNDFDFRKKLEETQELLMASVDEKNSSVRRLVDRLGRVETTAFGGGYNDRQYEETKEQVAELRDAVENGVIACDESRMLTALERADQLLDHYKAKNSFAAKADDEEVDVEGGLDF